MCIVMYSIDSYANACMQMHMHTPTQIRVLEEPCKTQKQKTDEQQNTCMTSV